MPTTFPAPIERHNKAGELIGVSCPVCGDSYKLKISAHHPTPGRLRLAVNMHIRQSHASKAYRCDHCPRTFTSPGSLAIHSEIHLSQAERLELNERRSKRKLTVALPPKKKNERVESNGNGHKTSGRKTPEDMTTTELIERVKVDAPYLQELMRRFEVLAQITEQETRR